MILKKKYKICISALLLTVYFFIAAPTQLWHHHDVVAEAIKAPGKQASLAKLPAASLEGSCQVCSHQYSAYIDYAPVLFAAPAFLEQSTQDFFYLSIPSEPAFSLVNKGPPVFL